MKKSLAPYLIPMLLSAATSQPMPHEESGTALMVGELQYIVTHNSYHIAPDEAVLSFMRGVQEQGVGGLPGGDRPAAREYTHPTLTVQLARGIRAFELDIHDDAAGGRYSRPSVYALMPPDIVSSLPDLDPARKLLQPGFKTFHDADFDMRSTCLLFRDCLKEVAAWRRANPGHVPIFVFLEVKSGFDQNGSGEGWGNALWRGLEGEILSEFSHHDLILPDDIVKDSLRWPILFQARGKIAFMLFPYGDRPTESYAKYLSESGDRGLLHLNMNTGEQSATWASMNDPSMIREGRDCSWAGEAPGPLLYTKADTMGVQDRSRAELAMSSRANFVATDFPGQDSGLRGYSISFDGKYVRLACGRNGSPYL